MKKIVLSLLLLCIAVVTALAQSVDKVTDKNYQQILNDPMKYPLMQVKQAYEQKQDYKARNVDPNVANRQTENDAEEFEGEDHLLQRGIRFYMDRLDSNGMIVPWNIKAAQAYQEYKNTQAANKLPGAPITANWQAIGPVNFSTGVKIHQEQSSGIGRIDCIAIDPTNDNIMYAGSPSGGLWKTINKGQSWVCITDNIDEAVGVSDIVIDPLDPDIIYFASGDREDAYPFSFFTGVFRSSDGGQTWEKQDASNGLFVTELINNKPDIVKARKLLINSNNPSELLLATDIGLYKTINSGTLWTPIQIEKIMNPPPNLTLQNIFDINVKPGDAMTIYLLAKHDNKSLQYGDQFILFKSINFGQTFSEVTSLGLDEDIFSPSRSRGVLAINPSHPDEVYVAMDQKTASEETVFDKLLKSSNSGLTWDTLITNHYIEASGGANSICDSNILGNYGDLNDTTSQSDYDFTIGIDPSTNFIYIGGIDYWESDNGGNSFSHFSTTESNNLPKLLHADQHAIVFNSQNEMFVGNDGGIYQLTDKNNVHWQPLCNGLQISNVYNSFVNDKITNKIWLALQDNSIGVITNLTDNDQNNNFYEKYFFGDGLEVANVNNNVYGMSQDGDLHLLKINELNVKNPTDKPLTVKCAAPYDGTNWNSSIYVNPTDENKFVFGNASTYYSENAGTAVNCAFEATTANFNPSSGSTQVRKILPSLTTPNKIYAIIQIDGRGKAYHNTSYKSRLLASTDGGKKFKSINNPGSNMTSIAVGKWQGKEAVFGSCGNYINNEKVKVLTDGATVWQNIDPNLKLPNVPVNCIVFDTVSLNNDVYIGTDAGVYYRNETDDWVEFNGGMPKCLITDLDIDYKKGILIASTFGRGLWQCDLLSSTKVEIISDAGPTICTGDTIELKAIGISGTYSWSNGATVNPCTINASGTYTVTVTSQTNLTATASIKIGNSTDIFHVYWENQYGGNKDDIGVGIVYADDKIFISGTTFSNDPNSNVAGDLTANVYTSAIKSSSGSQKWHVTMGGSNDDKASGIALNSEKDLIIAATSSSAGTIDVPSNSGASNGDDFWVFKLKTDGSLGKSGKSTNPFTYTFDESVNDNLNSIISGPGSTIFLGGGSATTTTVGGVNNYNLNYYVKRINGIDGKEAGSYKFDGNGYEEIHGMAYVRNGSSSSIYMTGQSASNPTTNLNSDFYNSIWPVKFGGIRIYREFFKLGPLAFNLNVGWTVGMNASSGNIKCNSIFGGDGINSGNCISSSLDKNIYIAGESASQGFHMASVQKFGGFDIYARKQRADGVKHDWVVSAGGAGTDYAKAILTTTDNGIIVAGSSNSPNGDDIVNAKGGFDIFIVNYDANGTKMGSINLGNVNDDEAKAMVWDTDSSNFYVCGTKSKSANDKDIYVAKITCNTCPMPYKNFIAQNKTTTGAILTWDDRLCADSYEIMWRKANSTDVFDKDEPTLGLYTLSSLSPATLYEWKVRSKCANGNYSVFSPLQYFTTMSIRDAVSLTKDADFNLQVYPNPNNGNFNLELDVQHDATGSLVIMDELGRVIYQHELTVIEGKNVIDIAKAGLAQGTYFAKVTIEGEGTKAIRVAVF